MAVERVRQMSVGEFLDFAEHSEEWYEYIDGEVCPMPAAQFNHYAISGNIGFLLSRLLASTDCLVLPGGMLIRAGAATLVAPDVSVVCGEPETEADTRILLNPTVVVEFISPSSVSHDRVLKRDLYESVASINAYLIVEQHRPLVELYRRSETGWRLLSFRSLDHDVALEALDCRLPLRDIYQSIEFEGETDTTAASDA